MVLKLIQTLAFASFLVLILTLSSCGPTSGAVTSSSTFGFCPVCHMKVNASDDWAAEIYYKDQTKLMFESPGDLLAFYTSPGSYKVGDAHKDNAAIERIQVKDYKTRQATDARQAVFVYKSRVQGPMGADFFPFAKKIDAESFVAENGGIILSLSEVTGEMARDLRK